MFGDKLKEIISKGNDENQNQNQNETDKTIKQISKTQIKNDKQIFEKSGDRTSNQKEQSKSKKQIENMVFFIIILVITVIIINSIWKSDTTKADKTQTNTTNKTLATYDNSQEQISSGDLEKRLEAVLINIQGVEAVKVLINYSESIETVAMYNETSKTSETEETDTSGGVRTINQVDSQKEVVYKEENGIKTPITQKTVSPKPEGAIITVKGAGNSTVKSNVIQAVEAVTGLATHKIQVFEMN